MGAAGAVGGFRLYMFLAAAGGMEAVVDECGALLERHGAVPLTAEENEMRHQYRLVFGEYETTYPKHFAWLADYRSRHNLMVLVDDAGTYTARRTGMAA